MESNTSDNLQKAVSSFKDYEEYLDSKSKESARKLVEHGHKGTVLSRQEFEQRKAASASATRDHRNRTATLASSGCDIRDNFLKELAQREEVNRTGKMTSLIFIRDVNAAGQEVSGYIDYAHRLQMQDFAPYFSGRKKLVPGPRDLCYYNWTNQATASTSSSNYDVVYDRPCALLFRRKTDGGIVNVDPRVRPGQGVRRSGVPSGLYEHVVILDHDSARTRAAV